MHTFQLTISAIDEVKYFGQAESVTCPGAEGELTILKDHEPLVTTLKEGKITVRNNGEVVEFEAKKGTLEVSKEGVTILL
jgi:F-type H+-transporting ATPase subunit epsilon